MAAFTAFFDESVARGVGEPICVAGVVFTPGDYKRFCRYWCRNVLRNRGQRFAAFHMTDLVAGEKDYGSLSIRERIGVLDHAVLAVSRYATAGVAVCFAQEEFERKAPPDWPEVFGSIYSAACGMCLQATGLWLTRWGHQMEVRYVFERGHSFSAQADEFLTAYGQDRDMRQRCRYRSHSFGAKSEVGLQAADLAAWTIAKAAISNGTPPRSMVPFVESVMRLANNLNDRYRIHRFEGVLLDRYLHECMTEPLHTFRRRGGHRKGFR